MDIPPPSGSDLLSPHYQTAGSINATISRTRQRALDLYLCTAVYFNCLGWTKRLVAHGANVNCKLSSHGTTPLHIAAERNYKPIAEFLISKGALLSNVNATGFTPRGIADSNTEVWTYLISLENPQLS